MRSGSVLLLFAFLLSACAPQPAAPSPPTDATAKVYPSPPVPCGQFHGPSLSLNRAVALPDRRFAVVTERDYTASCFRFIDDALSWARELASQDPTYRVRVCATTAVPVGQENDRFGCWWMTRFVATGEQLPPFDAAHQAVVQGVERDCTRAGDDERCKVALGAMWEQK